MFVSLFLLFVVSKSFGFTNFKHFFVKNNHNHNKLNVDKRYYPYSNQYFEQYIKQLNSKNISILQHQESHEKKILYDDNKKQNKTSFQDFLDDLTRKNPEVFGKPKPQKNIYEDFDLDHDDDYPDDEDEDDDDNTTPIFIIQGASSAGPHMRRKNQYSTNDFTKTNTKKKTKSENFEVLEKSPITFQDIGGYDSIKQELQQCVDILHNYEQYAKYNVRIPKGLILEGPPGNGKTMIAKGLAGEANTSFIVVSGSEFQDKFVGVGASRVRELFELARENIPCVIFIDEIDAIGRKRSSDSETASSERDSTLNQLLINMDGFKTANGIFVVGATNRADLLDPALIRPGRIDKRVYIGLPDVKTREAILNIHIKGKPHDNTVNVTDLVEITMGLSGAQLENVLNEAMLFAIRQNRTEFTQNDIEMVMNRIIAGWQPVEHQFTTDMLEQIAIHEMGHAIVGLLSKQHSKMTKVVINLSSPQSPGYTIFEGSTTSLYTREALFEHLMILLAGRIAEEVFYNVSVTTGAINDFEEALKLSEKMIIYYGMGRNVIYPSLSEKYKERIDNEVIQLIQDAYRISTFLVTNCKDVIYECAGILKTDRILRSDDILTIINDKYPYILDLRTF
jgi:cell division protease FtsH